MKIPTRQEVLTKRIELDNILIKKEIDKLICQFLKQIYAGKFSGFISIKPEEKIPLITDAAISAFIKELNKKGFNAALDNKPHHTYIDWWLFNSEEEVNEYERQINHTICE